MSSAAPSSEIYALQRNEVASTRLNCQHYIWRSSLGYNIHPSITLSENARICDVAAGTGLWLLEVAEEYPNSLCDGLDISIFQAPPQAWLPKNVSMKQWDMMSALPPGSEGIYDFVHIRLVILALEDNVAPLLRNLLKLLKPGGWLQWDEPHHGPYTLRDETTADGAIDQGSPMEKLTIMMRERSSDWLVRLPEHLEAYGFELVSNYVLKPLERFLKFETDINLMVWEEIIEKKDHGERKAMLRKIVDAVKYQANHGAGFAASKTIAIARKPVV